MPQDHETGGTPLRKEKAEMESILKGLELAVAELNNTAARANELIRSANDRLAQMQAGIPFVSTCRLRDNEPMDPDLDEDPDDPGFEAFVLVYAKIKNTWQLGLQIQCYAKRRDYVDEPDYKGYVGGDMDYHMVGHVNTPLLSADREIRIEAARRLPEFLGQYTAHLTALSNKLKDSKE
jgi:hypothetical protein